MKKLFLKFHNIHWKKVASGQCFKKMVFLVVDRDMKLTCSYIDQHLL